MTYFAVKKNLTFYEKIYKDGQNHKFPKLPRKMIKASTFNEIFNY